MKAIHGLLISIMIFTVISCNEMNRNLVDTKIVYLFNPQQKEIIVKVDNNEVEIQPEDATPVQLKYGIHFVEYKEIIDSFFVDSMSNLVINPLRDTLISEEIIYLPNDKKDSELSENDFEIPFISLRVGDLMYYGPFVLTNDLLIKDWDYGPGHPVNLQINQNSYIKPGSKKKLSIIKLYSKSEFVNDVVSINHSENYINEKIQPSLKVLSDEVEIKIKGDEFHAGLDKMTFGLADIYVSIDDKICLTIWEAYDLSIHGKKKDIKFIIEDCTIINENTSLEGATIQGITVSNKDYIVLDVQ